MKKLNDLWFLHVSDFHITDPTGDVGFLRKGHYKDLIGGLATKILGTITTECIAGIVFSGDIIDKGGMSNLPHGTVVFEYLCKKLEVDKTRVVAIRGNHDFDWNVANNHSYPNAIEPVSKFFKKYGQILPDSQSPLGVLHKLQNKVFVLTLDSMLGAPSGHPGTPGKQTGNSACGRDS